MAFAQFCFYTNSGKIITYKVSDSSQFLYERNEQSIYFKPDILESGK